VRAVSFSHDGAFLAAAGDDDAVDVSDAGATGAFARVASVPVRGGSVSSMRWSPTHHVLAFAGEGGDRGNAGSVALWAAPSSARR
jgi:WD40 repeat protein